jgi:hypothetical protein
MRPEKNKFFYFSSILVIAAGCTTFFLEKDWTQSYSHILKVPIFSIVGMSLTYTIIFGLVDFINFVISNFQS